ncbi:Cell adhesion molecule [Apis cerana cerana]|uniref:Cell adhesion molecule n=1 Tax=Apis cerana cerana TaxID=94128 RepID=A0A2A3EL40_APICC|nr:Cell adhesion molecule [Apis cerana cerana]
MLLLMSMMMAWFVAAEVFLGDVDEPIPMLDVSAVAGFKAQIPCDIDPVSRSEVAKLWSDPYVFGKRATMRTSVEPAKLEIDPLEAADVGVYRCRVDYKNSPTRNQKVNLTVIVPPNKPVIYTGAGRSLAKILQSFNEGSELSLLCEVIGGSPPPKVTWHFNGAMDDTYTLEHVKPLLVNITNKRAHLSALRTYEIECTSSGSRPEAVITWWKGNHQVKHMARNFADSPNITRSVLSYVPTMEDDGKYLTCRAENPVVPDSALENRWRLLVYYSPIVTIKLGLSLKANDINEGDDVYFECDVQANPKAYKLVWYKDGKELHQNMTARIFLPSGQSLVLRSVTRNSAGEYSCMAVNVEGKSTSRPVTLEIMYAPSKPPPITFHWTFNNSGELMNVPSNRFTPIIVAGKPYPLQNCTALQSTGPYAYRMG